MKTSAVKGKADSQALMNPDPNRLETEKKPVRGMITAHAKHRLNHWKYTLNVSQSDMIEKAILFFDKYHDKIEKA